MNISPEAFYDIPAFGNVSLLHFTDCHAQLLPIYYREPSINLGVGTSAGKVPHLVGIAIIGQAFPHTPKANGAQFTPDWAFGIDEARLQQLVEEVRKKGAQVVVLLSHNGMDIDLKLASRVSGIDIILGGHTHDGVPIPVVASNTGGKTIVSNAGSHGKFLAVIDFDVKDGRVADYRYHLLPVFSDLLPADAAMQATIDRVRAPYLTQLQEPLAEAQQLLYRRGNFNGSWDQLIIDALMQVNDAEIAFSPGFRWGTTLLPGQIITREHLMEQTAITYPNTSVVQMTGMEIKQNLEKLCDKIFNDDPYQHQGGDMVRTGGLSYTCEPGAKKGARISEMQLRGKALEADKTYKVTRWGVGSAQSEGPPVWDIVETYFKNLARPLAHSPNVPRLIGVTDNPGIDAATLSSSKPG